MLSLAYREPSHGLHHLRLSTRFDSLAFFVKYHHQPPSLGRLKRNAYFKKTDKV